VPPLTARLASCNRGRKQWSVQSVRPGAAVAADCGGPLSDVALKGGRQFNGAGAYAVLKHPNLRMLYRVAEDKHQLGSPTSVTVSCCGPVLQPVPAG
jgi:hypothetical protein